MHRRGRGLRGLGRKRFALPLILAFALPVLACEPSLLRRQTFFDLDFFKTHATIRGAFFDADHTLRVSRKDHAGFVDSVDDIEILPGVVRKIRDLNAHGRFVAIFSNQGGVPKHRTLREVDEVLERTVAILREQGAIVHYYDFAEGWDRFRKPETGMIDRLEIALEKQYGRVIKVDRENSFMVGDAAYTAAQTRPDGRPGTDRSDSDRVFAEKAGMKFIEAKDYFGWGTQIAP